jgi:hypothetical protein
MGFELEVPWARPVPLAEALQLIERVRASAREHALLGLERLAAALPGKITAIALRACPPLPATVEERIADYRAQTMADAVMYREALAAAAASLGWTVHAYDRKTVFDEAAKSLGVRDLGPLAKRVGAAVGPPWQADHRFALAAAIVAGRVRKWQAGR